MTSISARETLWWSHPPFLYEDELFSRGTLQPRICRLFSLFRPYMFEEGNRPSIQEVVKASSVCFVALARWFCVPGHYVFFFSGHCMCLIKRGCVHLVLGCWVGRLIWWSSYCINICRIWALSDRFFPASQKRETALEDPNCSLAWCIVLDGTNTSSIALYALNPLLWAHYAIEGILSCLFVFWPQNMECFGPNKKIRIPFTHVRSCLAPVGAPALCD